MPSKTLIQHNYEDQIKSNAGEITSRYMQIVALDESNSYTFDLFLGYSSTVLSIQTSVGTIKSGVSQADGTKYANSYPIDPSVGVYFEIDDDNSRICFKSICDKPVWCSLEIVYYDNKQYQ